jgi:hypothetical protein
LREIEHCIGFDVAWVGPRRAVASIPGQQAVWSFDGDVARREEFQTLSQKEVREVERYPGIGTFALTAAQELLVREDGSWSSKAQRLAIGQGRQVLLPLDEGVMFGGREGAILQYHPGYGLCQTDVIAGIVTPEHMTPVEGGYLAISVDDMRTVLFFETAAKDACRPWMP